MEDILYENKLLIEHNLYSSQIEQLLSEMNVKKKVKVRIEEWFKGFKEFVMQIKPSKPCQLNKAKKLLGNVKIPFPKGIIPRGYDKSTFQWTPPNSIYEVGSWTYSTSVSKISPFDIAIEMPSTLFHKSDVRNHLYHFKRAVYVAYLGKELCNSADDVKIKYDGGNPLRPILQIYIKSKRILSVQIHFILPTTFEKFIKKKLGPTRNNIRIDYFLNLPVEGENIGPKTPAYNQAILKDLYFKNVHEYVLNSLQDNKNICNAIKLLKIWLTQRSLSQGFGAFSGFIMTMFIIYLEETEKINSKMSVYQILRIAFVNLMECDWCNNGIHLNAPLESEEAETCVTDVLSDWESSSDVVFLDWTGYINFTINMSNLTFRRIKAEAKMAIESLNSSSTSSFQSLFLTKAHFVLNFDHILQFEVLDDWLERLKSSEKWNSIYLNWSGHATPIISAIVGPIMERCLNKRSKLIDHELIVSEEYELLEDIRIQRIHRFGVQINRENAFKLIEKCESEDNLVSLEFRKFWGEDNVQLRRFMDGTMLESISFENVEDKGRIPFYMLKHIFERHLEIEISTENGNYLDTQLERLFDPEYTILKLVDDKSAQQRYKKTEKNKGQPQHKRARLDKEKTTVQAPMFLDDITNLALKSFDKLNKLLREIEGLPLDIVSVQGTSPILRFSNISPTPPQRFSTSSVLTEAVGAYLRIKEDDENISTISKLPKYVEPIGVVIQLESSGKWPDDVKAIDRLKCAFLLRIGQLLKSQFSLTVQFYPRFLYVLLDGFIFRVKLTYFRELTLLRQLRGEDGILRTRDNPESLSLEKESLMLPQLTSILYSLHRQNGSFGITCRLAKRWVSSHLLLGIGMNDSSSGNLKHHDARFTEESIELLVSSIFLNSTGSPFLDLPNEGQLGFLRFLNLLGNTNWKSTPIILNFYGKLSKDEIEKIETDFTKRRDSLPLLFISTPGDTLGSVWTKHLSPTILQRCSMLAKIALETFMDGFYNKNEEDLEFNDVNFLWKKIFTPSIKVFDVIIWIKKEMIARKVQKSTISNAFNGTVAGQGTLQPTNSTFNEYVKNEDEIIPIVDFDPMKIYYQELKETFGHLCEFVMDIYGGNFIAFAWKPNVTESTGFEISQIRGRKLGKDQKSLVLDIDAILEEIEFMGEGIVENIELKNAPMSD